MSLNPKQEAFCIEYLKDFNGTQAAIRAGYSAKTAEVKASQLLSIVKIQQHISTLREKATSDVILSLIQRKELLSHIAMNAEPKDGVRAIDVLNKMDGVYTQKIEHSGKIDINSIANRLVGK